MKTPVEVLLDRATELRRLIANQIECAERCEESAARHRSFAAEDRRALAEVQAAIDKLQRP